MDGCQRSNKLAYQADILKYRGNKNTYRHQLEGTIGSKIPYNPANNAIIL